MNVAFLPGFAPIIPGPIAVAFSAQVDLSLMAPALWIASSKLSLSGDRKPALPEKGD